MQHNSEGVCFPKRNQAYGYNPFCEKGVFSLSIKIYDNATFSYSFTALSYFRLILSFH
jgi:hypothetical protein